VILLAVAVVGAAVLIVRRWRKRRAPRRRAALAVVALFVGFQALFGAPAFAQGLFDCKQPPIPDRPGTGMVGVLDPSPIGQGQPGSAYSEVAYGGLIWHTYDLGCGPQGVANPNAVVDTWVGNELFNVSKNVIGATNGLHYALLEGNLLRPLDDMVRTGTAAIYNSVFTPLFGLVALVLAVLLFRHIWDGDLASIGKRSMWALVGLWFAAATYLTPLVYTQALDNVVIKTTSAVQAGFLQQVGVDQIDGLPTLLHDQVVYRNWLRGEFGSADAPQAQRFGRDLLRAQTWTKQEVQLGQDAGSPDQKEQQFQNIGNQLGSAYGYFQGVQGSRIGDGMLAMVESFAFALFQLLAKATILLAQVLLRMLILGGPVIGLIALVYHDVLRAVGRVLGSAMLNVVLISAMAGIHTLVLSWIFNPANGFSPLTEIVLAALMTLVFLLVGKPIRRMGQMIELSVGGSGGVTSGPPVGLLSRWRRRSGQRGSQPSDDFWDQVRTSDYPDQDEEAMPRGRRFRVRPEADATTAADPSVTATAQRMDRNGIRALHAGGAPTGAGRVQPSLPGADPGFARRPGSTAPAYALPESRPSRVADTAPVVESVWDAPGEDPVLVPSRRDERTAPSSPEPLSPKPADMEVVQGRPVYVIFRPSRGLEVADDRDTGSRAGQGWVS
jgi:hypothetical protein